jgi:hypothetical protein
MQNEKLIKYSRQGVKGGGRGGLEVWFCKMTISTPSIGYVRNIVAGEVLFR